MRVHAFGSGRWLLAVALAGLVVTLAAVALGRGPVPSLLQPRVARPAEAPRSAGEGSALRPADPAGIRDVFRFADEPRPAAHREAAAARVEGEGTPPRPRVRASSAWCGGPAA